MSRTTSAPVEIILTEQSEMEVDRRAREDLDILQYQTRLYLQPYHSYSETQRAATFKFLPISHRLAVPGELPSITLT